MTKKNKFFKKGIDLQLFASKGMENLDLIVKSELELQEEIKNAIESGDSEAFAKVQIELAKGIEARILQEAKQSMNEDLNDQAVMVKRGLNPLTTEEKAYYNEVISGAGFAGTEKLMPATIFDRVFEDLRQNHPLLSEINFVNTTATTEWITRNNDVEAAWWGILTASITKKLEMAFKKEKTELYKLSAFVPVAKAMLDLGPQWLDRFVREILFESLAIALELAIVAGTGKDQPIGMIKNLVGAVVDGVYPDKTAVVMTDLKPGTLGTKIMAPLTKGGKRAVSSVLLVVNPITYWKKIFPQTTYLTADKTYVYGVLPIPAKVVQSVAVVEDKMIAGMAKDYFMGVGSTQKVEYSDHYKFLEDERTYIAKQYANGKPLDNEGFLVFDISDMEVEIPEV
ncbi:phage major capsid protein, HK97 family [Natronincola peptidivorans]|uniref:Phage major capsid protein, HK97 family n=1 Tax=Natronincola peptidivorans TaxID=426128 RepID=A0A1I0FEN5_9FIRM|nr:phage major capsid protein [Natronincola peptidivorans]SET55665.1 phage major capsid protein, HK97 family [Natronincola peptidivorans]